MNWSKLKLITFKTFFFSAILGFILTIPVIGQCQCLTNRFYANKDYMITVLTIFFLILILQFFAYTFDFLRRIIKGVKTKFLKNQEVKCYLSALGFWILWLLVVLIYSVNGNCDMLIGPAESGLGIALLISIGVNFWKLKIIEQK